jgi:hypothetical protein
MAMSIVKSYKELRHQLNIKDIFDRFWAWAASGPKDIGFNELQITKNFRISNKTDSQHDPQGHFEKGFHNQGSDVWSVRILYQSPRKSI